MLNPVLFNHKKKCNGMCQMTPDKGSLPQAWGSKLDTQDLHVGRREQTPTSDPLTSTCMLRHVCLSTNTLCKQIHIKTHFKTLQWTTAICMCTSYYPRCTVQELSRYRVAKPEASTWVVLLGGRKSPEDLHQCTQLLAAEQVCFPITLSEHCVTEGFVTLSGFH